MSGQAAYRVNGALVSSEQFYAVACDPARSVAVEACAGAGKTWMLVSRILRALIDGCEPQDILAITFTRKAAGEMRERLMGWLQDFSQAPPDRCERELVLRGMSPAQARAQAPVLASLHDQVLASGRPVQIRTFHSWFASLLRLAPLSVMQELRLPPEHELLEDDAKAIALAWPRFHRIVADDDSLRQDYLGSVARYGRSQTEKALVNALGTRVEFLLADQAAPVEASVEPFGALFTQWAHLAEPCLALLEPSARQRWYRRSSQLGTEKNKTPQSAAQAVIDAFELADDAALMPQRLQMLRKAFLVAGEDRLTRNLAKYEAAIEAEAELQALLAATRQHEAWLHQQRMSRLCRCLIGCYADLKHERGWVDMSDVEMAARRLLGDAELSGWMQQRLDARVRQLLVDEFQDTNPLQWQALYGWLSAYAGAGVADGPRVFLVGDPKQSIYRFRRAEPQVFLAAQAFVVQGLGGVLLSCDHTRRCAQAVIGSLNAVMEGAAEDAGYRGFRPHTTESPVPGEVLCLPRIGRAALDEAQEAPGQPNDAWRDSLQQPRVLPEDSLTTLEARQAAAWLAGELGAGRLQAGEVMVLARRRERLGRMHEALTALGIAAEEPEKRELVDDPAVQDVVALLDALVSTGHDLSLARALKSPIFAWSDRALSALARRRSALEQAQILTEREAAAPLSWWAVLHDWAEQASASRRGKAGGDSDTDDLVIETAQRMARYRLWSLQLPPHDALVGIYQDSDLRARYATSSPAHLRQRVLHALDGLLDQALAQDGGRYLSTYRFVRALKAGGAVANGLPSKEAVRLLTVHGAKGLEAHTVLILDTDAPPARKETMGVLVDWPGQDSHPRRFVFLASEKQPPSCAAGSLAQEQQARRLEELNALYVALTRAASRLVISSIEPHQRADTASWYERLLPHLHPLAPDAVHVPQEPQPQDSAVRMRELPATLPSCGTAATPDLPPTAVDEVAARLGLALHRLMQWVPTPAHAWQCNDTHLRAVAAEFGLTVDHAQQAAVLCRRMLTGQALWAWDDAQVDSWSNEAEVWLDGRLLRIDRLVRRRDSGHWWVLDYKSAQRPQEQAALRDQMYGYHRALARAMPGQTIRLAFINAQGELIELPAQT